MRHLFVSIRTCLFLTLVVASPALADVINFEAQTVARGGNLTGIPDSPLTIGLATFTGGELLAAEVGLNADQTGVYATEGLFGSGETNPLVITFASPVNAFSLLVVNGDSPASYTVSDNLGDSISMPLAATGAASAATFSLAGQGLNSVAITSNDSSAWIFSIDNVTLTPAAPVPEPVSLLLMSTGLIAVLTTYKLLAVITTFQGD